MTYGENKHPHADCRERIAELEAEVERLHKFSKQVVQEFFKQVVELELLRAERDELAKGGLHWWHEMRAVAKILGCSRLCDARNEVERLKDIVASLPHTAYGVQHEKLGRS